jgi:hypothetical protein
VIFFSNESEHTRICTISIYTTHWSLLHSGKSDSRWLKINHILVAYTRYRNRGYFGTCT